MEVDQLRTVVAAVEEGSLSAAARRRHLTQPAVSLQIKALEEELGTPLFHRRGRGVTPTQAGSRLYGRAREVLATLRSARNEVAGIAGALGGTLVLGVTDAAATGILPRAFTAFHRAHPAVEVRVAVHATSELVSLLRERRIDLGLGTLPGEGEALPLETRPLREERLHLVAPPAEEGPAAPEALADQPFIAYPAGSTTRRLVDAALAAASLAPRISMEIGRPDVMIRLVEAGVGISVLPATLVTGAVRALDPPGFAPSRILGLILPPGEPEPLAGAFVDCLEPD